MATSIHTAPTPAARYVGKVPPLQVSAQGGVAKDSGHERVWSPLVRLKLVRVCAVATYTLVVSAARALTGAATCSATAAGASASMTYTISGVALGSASNTAPSGASATTRSVPGVGTEPGTLIRTATAIGPLVDGTGGVGRLVDEPVAVGAGEGVTAGTVEVVERSVFRFPLIHLL